MATPEQQSVRPFAGSRARPQVRVRIPGFIVTVQAILFAVHLFVYETWSFFSPPGNARGWAILRAAAVLLSVSFVCASLLAYQYWNVWVRMFYRVAAVWLGLLNFIFLAACGSWVALALARLAGWQVPRSEIADVLFAAAVLVGLYGFVNARWPRVKRIVVELPNLPEAWRGRVAAVVSDVHLGHVNGAGFTRRIVTKLRTLRPDVVFLPGDLYDGTNADLDAVVAPWKEFSEAAFGVYFVTGNHEEFSDRGKYLRAVRGAGLQVLNNEKVTVDGLQIVGMHDGDSHGTERFTEIMERAGVDRGRASILLTHVPRGLAIAEKAGISLQICGHTHGGQIFPFTWFTRRVFGAYTYGLQRLGELQVYTSCGAGTWGPPMRVGTRPEIVLMELRGRQSTAGS